MFTLFVSYNCGISYDVEAESKELDVLKPKMAKFDKNMLRWYLEKDGKFYQAEICPIHKGIFQFMAVANKSIQTDAEPCERCKVNATDINNNFCRDCGRQLRR